MRGKKYKGQKREFINNLFFNSCPPGEVVGINSALFSLLTRQAYMYIRNTSRCTHHFRWCRPRIVGDDEN